ncbi:hypothetical protein COCSUDRAFT_42427 [Coccomyxa subellipsoidea C-169]|uniref:TAP42-like protein n=1 Tax=Coccomyxa subellipsoidea (strain C-169) TaxID=574566 RepID=I0YWR1_COCSC|nr:hypothetical protein COCSUDRAFT_42427 [Coccomyxa subellipsoidea C-169]EIE22830.1 hypothetical protein COCSUDRAFT_42427 [Coccomyxa subellipsoidea C-169]|eukprot:XP_005647374.1 hypothetical protein COCSUDRAFT_42427 [Coccomyxa subellipsoidea C-169]
MVAALGLFSSNEQAEDIATADLKYLLVPYLWGDLLSRSRTQDLSKRVQLLSNASELLRGFLEQCSEYGLLGPDEKSALMEAQGQGSIDPGTRRTQKIARIRLEKAARAKLDALRMQDLRRKRVSELEAEEAQDSVDEDMERDVWSTQIQLRTMKAANLLGSLKQEIELLSHAASLPEDLRERPAQPPPAALMQELHTAAAALSIKSDAQQMRTNVFRPSHILPTVTLAQQAEREIASAQRAAEARTRAEAARANAKAEDKDGEAETLRQRAWDDWKDDNPRGAGNSKLLPTA